MFNDLQNYILINLNIWLSVFWYLKPSQKNKITNEFRNLYIENNDMIFKLNKNLTNKDFYENSIAISKYTISIYPTHKHKELNEIIYGLNNFKKTKIKNLGYMGWKLIMCTNIPINQRLMPTQLKEKLNDPDVDNKLRFANHLFNDFCIIPITNDIKKLIKNNYNQSDLSKILTLNKIDELFPRQNYYIMKEISDRMIDQDLISSYKLNRKKYFEPGVNYHKQYEPGIYISPICRTSKPHLFCIKIIENYLLDNNLSDNIYIKDEFQIHTNIYNENKKNKPPRIDIALMDKVTKKVKAAIEADGHQHNEYVPHFHRNGISDFIKQQERDRKKDQWIKENTNFNCIRIKDLYFKNNTRIEPTGLEKEKYLIKKLDEFKEHYFQNN